MPLEGAEDRRRMGSTGAPTGARIPPLMPRSNELPACASSDPHARHTQKTIKNSEQPRGLLGVGGGSRSVERRYFAAAGCSRSPAGAAWQAFAGAPCPESGRVGNLQSGVVNDCVAAKEACPVVRADATSLSGRHAADRGRARACGRERERTLAPTRRRMRYCFHARLSRKGCCLAGLRDFWDASELEAL